MKRFFPLMLIALSLLTIVGCRFIKNTESNESYLTSTETITVSTNDYYYVFKPNKYTTGIVFYPKKGIDIISYAPLLHTLANEGYITFLAKDYVINNKDTANVAYNSYDNVTDWYIGGHSSGGTAAADYLKDNHLKFSGLFLLSSYSNVDLSTTKLKFLSVYGNQDKLLDMSTYNKNLSNIGNNVIEHIIEGGNHSFFNDDTLENDGTATITNKAQRELTIKYIKELINAEPPKIPTTPDSSDIPTNLIKDPVGENVTTTHNEEKWNISYNIDDNKSHSMSFEIVNHDTKFDTLYIKLNAPKNTNLGVRLYYLDSSNNILIKDLINNNSNDGILTLEGEQKIILFLKNYNLQGLKIIKLELLFDSSNEYTINTGNAEIELYNPELFVYDNLILKDLDFSVETTSFNYNGNPIDLKIKCEQKLSFKIEYSKVVENNEEIWTTLAPINAGQYNVRITYAGSLQYDYKVITSTITINKVKAQICSTDVTVDETTRIITINDGIVASLDENFTPGLEVLNGVQIPYGTTVYYKNIGDDNHIESDVLCYTFNKPLSLIKAEAVADVIKAIGNYSIDKTPYELSINSATTSEEIKTQLSIALADITNKKLEIEATKSLEITKNNAKAELEAYKSLDLYLVAEQALLTSIINTNKNNIDSATSVEEVISALANAKAAIDNIKTKAEYEAEEIAQAQALAKAKADAIVDIISNINNYNIDNTAYINSINSATSINEVEERLNEILEEIISKKAEIDFALALEKTKEKAKTEISNYKVIDLYRIEEQILLTNAINSAYTNINNATSIEEVNTIVKITKTTIDSIKTKAQYEAEELAQAQALAKAKKDAITEIIETIGNYNIDKTSYENTINSASSIDEIQEKLEVALNNIESKKDAIDAANAIIKAKEDAITEIIETIGDYNIDKTSYISSINSASSISEIETTLSLAILQINELKEKIDLEEAAKVKISNITSDTNATIIKNSKNEQIIQYNKSFGYHTFDIQVQNWNSSLSELKIIFTLSANTEVCFDINGKINWSYGHEELTGGIQHTKTFNSTDYPLAESFIIKIYFDAEVEVTENKIVTIHYIGFGEYVPEEVEKPEGTVTVNYEESVETFVNPDRGFYYPICLTAESTGIEQLGNTSKQIFNNNLIHLRIDIAAFSKAYNQNQDLELTTEMLNGLDAILTALNNSGVCIIIRFAYDRDFGGAVDNEPEINMIIKHIEQFSPLINKHKNMITAVECGLVGPWGEMHSSVIANQATYNKIFAKYLECLDEDVVLLVRRPCFIYEYYGLTVNELDKFDYENNRIGCYNDGYLGSASDLGTFVDREKEIAFLKKLAKFPYGGEVVRPESEYNHLSWACDEMFRTNLSYLNIQWNNIVIDRWQNTEYTLDDPLYKGQTEFTYIANHMGYRLVCESLDYIVDDNNILNFTLNIKNVGFGELLKPKKGFVILRDGLTEHVFEFDYNNELTIEQQIDLSNIDSGVYEFFFVLADDYNNSHAVRGIRFANTNMYDESNYSNKLANIVI